MADQARRYGIHIFYHTDGAARLAIPELLSVTGIEVLNPIQWRCPGMEREGLVRDFGDRLIFHGAMDNQQTMPFGSVEDVRQEVLDNIRIFSPTRWVCAPCHNLQAVSPTANIVAMYETIHEHGRLDG
jgi:uroporphyrinogen decarboxylase